MFSLSIALRGNPAVWMLLYKTKETADIAWDNLSTPDCEITDDYGQKIFLGTNVLAGAVYEDLDQSQFAHIARALHAARTQAKANSQANADPMLRTASMSQGPAVLSPMNGTTRY